MVAYLDSSVLLRMIFNEPNPISDLSKMTRGVSSELMKTECLRTLDRYRLLNGEDENSYIERVKLLHGAFKKIDFIQVSSEVLFRAGQPFPTQLGTLDAIHLASCLAYQEYVLGQAEKLTVCTHDESLKKAAIALGFETLG